MHGIRTTRLNSVNTNIIVRWRVRQWGSHKHHSLSLTCWLVGNPMASYQKRKLVGCACFGNVGNVFPAADFKGNHYLAIPVCITARASPTWFDACWDRQPSMAGKTFSAFLAYAQSAIVHIWQEAHIIDVVAILFNALQWCHMSDKASQIATNSTVLSTACSALHFSLLVTGI